MPSKGVDFYAFVANGYEIEIRKANAGKKDDPDKEAVKSGKILECFSKHYEIETDHWALRYEGKFQFIAKKDGKQLYERSIRVNGDTGNIDDEDLQNMMIPSRVEGDYSLSFGLYDSDSSQPNAHQLYAALTPNRSAWQGDFFKTVDTSKFRLRDMVLPGSHDAGMYNRMFVEASNMANTQKDAVKEQLGLGARYFDYRPGIVKNNFRDLVALAADNIYILYAVLMSILAVVALAVPFLGPLVFSAMSILGLPVLLILKGKMTDLLDYIRPKVEKICHVHAVIPGESLDDFVGHIVQFLRQHPQEIVVINIVDSGIIRDIPIPDGKVSSVLPDSIKGSIPGFLDVNVPDIIIGGKRVNGQKLEIVRVPDKAELMTIITQIAGGAGIKIGDKTTLDEPVSKVIGDNRRLIIFFREDNVSANDSYTDDYVNYDSGKVKAALENTLKKKGGDDFTKLQLQLTPTGTTPGIVRALKGTNICTSPLFATKPRTDNMSYQFLLQNAWKIKEQGRMVAVQNDFYDNALTEVAIALNKVNADLVQLFPKSAGHTLQNNQTFSKGQFITSPNGRYQLIFQQDGNLVLYNALHYPLWATDKMEADHKPATRAIMQEDGNLVVYTASDGVVWAANKAYDDFKFVKHARLQLDDDGTLGIYEPGGGTVRIIRQG